MNCFLSFASSASFSLQQFRVTLNHVGYHNLSFYKKMQARTRAVVRKRIRIALFRFNLEY